MNNHIEESTRKRAEMEEWMKNLLESTKLNTRNQNTSLENLETQIEQLAKDYKAKAANEVPDPSVGQCKAIFAIDEALTDEASSKGNIKLQGVSINPDENKQVPKEMMERTQELERLGEDLFSYESPACLELEQNTQLCDTNNKNLDRLGSFDNLQGLGVERKDMAKDLDSSLTTSR
ncbi:hypothetical protein Tco_1483521 [Tanacetum coccineum]